jgi:hypothetical protein
MICAARREESIKIRRSSMKRLIVDCRIELSLRRILSLSIFGPTTLNTNSSPNLLDLINTHLKYRENEAKQRAEG